MLTSMDGGRVGVVCRTLRIKRGWRQLDLARAAGVSRSDVSRLERGRIRELRLESVIDVIEALGAKVDFVIRWRGGELDRLLNSRHSALHDRVARSLLSLRGWELAPEVSFAIRGERGVIDILAWHGATRALLVIELKTEIVDINELLGTLDRKRRLAAEIARDRGWVPAVVGVWLIVADSATNRRRVGAHSAVLRAALPTDGRSVASWLKQPDGALRCLSFWANDPNAGTTSGLATVKRVRPRKPRGA